MLVNKYILRWSSGELTAIISRSLNFTHLAVKGPTNYGKVAFYLYDRLPFSIAEKNPSGKGAKKNKKVR